ARRRKIPESCIFNLRPGGRVNPRKKAPDPRPARNRDIFVCCSSHSAAPSAQATARLVRQFNRLAVNDAPQLCFRGVTITPAWPAWKSVRLGAGKRRPGGRGFGRAETRAERG